MKEAYIRSMDSCLGWIEKQMLTFDEGYHGMYERIRIDEHTKVNWVRPDCNTEMLRVLTLYEKLTGSGAHSQLAGKIKEWILRVQDNDPLSPWEGTFPFYLNDGHIRTGPDKGGKVYQNDNGRIMIGLLHTYAISKDERLLESAKRLADYWIGIQRPEGYFASNDSKTWALVKGPDFVLWLAAGFLLLYQAVGGEKYKAAAIKAYDYLLSIQMDNGRMKTSYELDLTEDWRPLSSETVKSLYSFSVAFQVLPDPRYAAAIEKLGEYTLSLQHTDGGILNNDVDTKDASLQNNEQLCDLVYTQGYALMALIEAGKATQNSKYEQAARNLADFLVSIQCHGESPLWDGAWRGSYNAYTRQWDGTANQNNLIDEGGMFSVYTGWSATNIMYGLVQLCE